eukprot:1145526-Pelagomonas_calceolata.AAC.3
MLGRIAPARARLCCELALRTSMVPASWAACSPYHHHAQTVQHQLHATFLKGRAWSAWGVGVRAFKVPGESLVEAGACFVARELGAFRRVGAEERGFFSGASMPRCTIVAKKKMN